jgi:hypothetical protein
MCLNSSSDFKGTGREAGLEKIMQRYLCTVDSKNCNENVDKYKIDQNRLHKKREGRQDINNY